MDKVVWALLVVPALSALLKDKEVIPWISTSLDWVYRQAIDLLGEPAFPWVAGTLLGIAIGVLSHRFLIWKARRKTEDRFGKFDSLSVDVLLHLHNSRGLSGAMNEDVSALQAKVQRLFVTLEKHRIPTPNVLRRDGVDILKSYIGYIRPFIEDRDIRVLRQRAKEWVDTHVDIKTN
jgi:hypothetical protein